MVKAVAVVAAANAFAAGDEQPVCLDTWICSRYCFLGFPPSVGVHLPTWTAVASPLNPLPGLSVKLTPDPCIFSSVWMQLKLKVSTSPIVRVNTSFTFYRWRRWRGVDVDCNYASKLLCICLLVIMWHNVEFNLRLLPTLSICLVFSVVVWVAKLDRAIEMSNPMRV